MAVMAPPSAAREQYLWERLIHRDHDAFAELYGQFACGVHQMATRIAGDSHAAHDITQEVFLQAWDRPASFDPERGSLRTWLALLTHAAAVRWLRGRESDARKVQRQEAERHVTAGPDEVASARISAQRARAALQRLPPHQRRALELAYVEGLTYREVATELGIPEGTAKSRIRLGLGHLARLVAA